MSPNPSRRQYPPKRVLIIEDDPAANKLIQAGLSGLGFEVRSETNGEAGVRFVDDHELDLVCLDLMLPDRSGFHVCEHIRQSALNRGVPVLVISARTEPEFRVHAEEAGANAYLMKPFRRAELRTHALRLLGLGRPAAASR